MAATIVYAEDNDNDVMLLQHAMRKAGVSAEVEVFNNGECLAHLRDIVKDGKPLPRLILLDLRMKPLTGAEILRQLRSIPQLHRIPRVILSAAINQENEQQLVSEGAAACIRKPEGAQTWGDVANRISQYL
jgi:CheY-like chemotaxis protein